MIRVRLKLRNFNYLRILPLGRRPLAGQSALIRHPSSKQSQEDIIRCQQQMNDLNSRSHAAVSPENHSLIKDAVELVSCQNGGRSVPFCLSAARRSPTEVPSSLNREPTPIKSFGIPYRKLNFLLLGRINRSLSHCRSSKGKD